MKNHKVSTMVSCATILSLLTPLASSQPAHAKVGQSCHSVCDEYSKSRVGGDGTQWDANAPMSMAYVIEKCGPIPGQRAPSSTGTAAPGTGPVADADRGISPDFRTGNDAWDKCYATDPKYSLREKWNQTGLHCAAIQLNKAGRKAGLTAASLYTVAAASCFTACAVEKVPFAQGFKGLCIGSGIAASASDLIGMITVAAKGEEEFKAASNVLTLSSQAAAAGGIAATSVSIAQNGAGTEAGGKASSCAAGALFTLAAGLKWANVKVMAKTANNECKNVLAFLSDAPENDTTDLTTNDANSAFVRSDGTTGTGTATSGSGGVIGGEYTAIAPSVFEGWNSGQFASATSGPLGSILESISPVVAKRALEEAAKIDPNMIISKLDSESPGDILSSMPGLSPEIAGAIQTLSKQTLDGSITLAGMDTPLESGLMKGGAKLAKTAAPTSASPFGGLFGSRGPASTGSGTGAEVSFEKMRQAITPEANGDVFHEGYAGSIFDLISVKIGKHRDRVESLEWDTPLNRALVGLPVKKSQVNK